MKKVLLARNDTDGLVSSLLLQERFKTCDPLFSGYNVSTFEALNVPVVSAGIPVRSYEFYVDDKGAFREEEKCVINPDRRMCETVFSLFPCDRYAGLVSLVGNVDFECFFDLYGASSCFGQLRSDPASWFDDNVSAYRKLQEETASSLLVGHGGDVEVFILPETAGRLCRRLIFLETDAKLVLMIQKDRFWLMSRHGYEKAFNLRDFKVQRKDGLLTGMFTGNPNPVRLRKRLEEAVRKYEDKGEMFR